MTKLIATWCLLCGAASAVLAQDADPFAMLAQAVAAHEMAIAAHPPDSPQVQTAVADIEARLLHPSVRALEHVSPDQALPWGSAILVLGRHGRIAAARRASQHLIATALGSRAETRALAMAAQVELTWAKDATAALTVLAAATVPAPGPDPTTQVTEPIHSFLQMMFAKTEALVAMGRVDEATQIAQDLAARFPGLRTHIGEFVGEQIRRQDQADAVRAGNRLRAIPDAPPVVQPERAQDPMRADKQRILDTLSLSGEEAAMRSASAALTRLAQHGLDANLWLLSESIKPQNAGRVAALVRLMRPPLTRDAAELALLAIERHVIRDDLIRFAVDPGLGGVASEAAWGFRLASSTVARLREVINQNPSGTWFSSTSPYQLTSADLARAVRLVRDASFQDIDVVNLLYHLHWRHWSLGKDLDPAPLLLAIHDRLERTTLAIPEDVDDQSHPFNLLFRTVLHDARHVTGPSTLGSASRSRIPFQDAAPPARLLRAAWFPDQGTLDQLKPWVFSATSGYVVAEGLDILDWHRRLLPADADQLRTLHARAGQRKHPTPRDPRLRDHLEDHWLRVEELAQAILTRLRAPR